MHVDLYICSVNLNFSNEVWYWRGPSPFYFVSVPEAQSRNIKDISKFITYGWGVIPATVKIGKTEWGTSLIPKDGLYLVPLKNSIRARADIALGDVVRIKLTLAIEARKKV